MFCCTQSNALLLPQKELSRLQGQSGFTNNGFVCESPSAFKWDQANGTLSPLMFDKRATQVFILFCLSRTLSIYWFCFLELMFLTVSLLSLSRVVFRGEIMILHLSPLLGGSRKKKQS